MNTDTSDTKQLCQLYQLMSVDDLASLCLLGEGFVVVVVCFTIEKPDCSSSAVFPVAELTLKDSFSFEGEKYILILFTISHL